MNPSPLIYTIGYGSRTIQTFITLLQEYRIGSLIDIRSKPYSRFKPDFSKGRLEALLAQEGIQYSFMGDLLGGKPELPAVYTPEGQVDYALLSQQEFYQRGIQRLRDAWQQKLPIALMCAEVKPERCHRTNLVGESLTREGIEVAHIDETGQLISQDEARLRSARGQLNLF